MSGYSVKSAGSGFSLVELMVVVAVIAILASIAYPSYQQHIRTVRRADATTVLLDAAQFLERYYTENIRYDQNAGGTAVALPALLTQSPKDGSAKFYDISIQSVSQQAYVIRATPKNAQAGDGYLEYTNAGIKQWDRNDNGSIGSDELCWQKSC